MKLTPFHTSGTDGFKFTLFTGRFAYFSAKTPSHLQSSTEHPAKPNYSAAMGALSSKLESWKDYANGLDDPQAQREIARRVENGSRYYQEIASELGSREAVEDVIAEWDRLHSLNAQFENQKIPSAALENLLDSELSVLLPPEVFSKAILSDHTLSVASRLRSVLGKTWIPQGPDPDSEGLLEYLDAKTKDSIQSALREAMALLRQKMAEYAQEKIKPLVSSVDAYIGKWASELEPGTADELRRSLDLAHKRVTERIGYLPLGHDLAADPLGDKAALSSEIRIVTEWAKSTFERLEEQDRKMTDFMQDRQGREERLRDSEARLGSFMANPAVSTLAASMATMAKKAKGLFQSGKTNAAQVALSGNDQTQKDVAVATAIPRRTAESILDCESEIKVPIGAALERMEKGAKVRMAQEAVAQGGTVDELLKRLEDTLGEQHVDRVTSSVFEEKYRRYTTEGSMVFAIRGDQWRIIVDESRIADPTNTLKDDLAHELRHLEFETDDHLVVAWEQAFATQLSPKEWLSVKQAFVNRYGKKTPPNYKKTQTNPNPNNTKTTTDKKGTEKVFGHDDWNNRDLLSELYAMAPDWSFLGAEALALANQSKLRADFLGNDALSSEWMEKLGADESTPEWEGVRNSMAVAFKNRFNAAGEPITSWDDKALAAEVYSLDPATIEANPALSKAILATGAGASLVGRSKSSVPYDESLEERFLGAEKGKKGKGDDAEDGNEAPTLEKVREKLQGDLEAINKKYLTSPYLGSVPGGKELLLTMKHHVTEALGMLETPEAEGRLDYGSKLHDRIQEDLETSGESLKNKLIEVSESQGNPETNPILSFWKNTKIYCWADFVNVFEHGKDYFTRQMKKGEGIRKANLSKIAYDGINEGLTQESSSFQSGAWKEIIQGWEAKFKSKNVSALKKYLKEQAEATFPDKGMVSAIINILSEEKGAMDWKDKNLWICLNKLQEATYFDLNDKLLYEDEDYLREKLKKAFASPPMYNKATAFVEREKSNERKYKENKDSFDSVISKSHDRIGTRLYTLLALKKEKIKTDIPVDPAEYERLIEYSIVKGVFSPQDVVFYLWCGMATGLLDANTGKRLTEHWNTYPMMAYFASGDNVSALNTTGKIKAIVEKNFKTEFENCKLDGGNGSKFRKFYWTVMANDPGVKRRTVKTAKKAGDGWDHDWASGFAMLGDGTVFTTMLESAAGTTTEPSMPPNIYVGFLQWFENNESPSKKVLIDRLSGYITFKSILSNAAFRSKSYIRDPDISMDAPAGESGSSNHPNDSVQTVSNNLGKIMRTIPALGPIFDVAIDSSSASNEESHVQRIKTTLKAAMPSESLWIDQNIHTSDEFYSNLRNILTRMFAKMSDGELTKAMRKGLPSF